MRKALLPLAPIAAMAIAAMPLAPALAAGSGTTTLQANLSSLNNSGASGTAWVTVDGNQVTVKITSKGLVKGMPHAQHIHIGGTSTCPSGMAEDANGDGIISTKEAAGDYGAVHYSLTTSGDTSASSALAVDRFPAPADGMVNYTRTFTVSDADAALIKAGKAAVVQHGIDVNGNGKYDAAAGPSSLDPSLPLEATAPADCGVLMAMPTGGAATGGGGTAGTEDAWAFAVGGALLLGAGAVAVSRRRTAAADQS